MDDEEPLDYEGLGEDLCGDLYEQLSDTLNGLGLPSEVEDGDELNKELNEAADDDRIQAPDGEEHNDSKDDIDPADEVKDAKEPSDGDELEEEIFDDEAS